MDTPVDDGSNLPLGFLTLDGCLEVREFVDKEGIPRRGYCETELGQHQRWMTGAPELYEKYQDLLLAVQAFLTKWDDVEPRIAGMFALSFARSGVNYSGPTIGEEITRLRAVARLPEAGRGNTQATG